MARKISPESVKNAQLEFGSDKIIIEAFENARPHELNQTISEISTKDVSSHNFLAKSFCYRRI